MKKHAALNLIIIFFASCYLQPTKANDWFPVSVKIDGNNSSYQPLLKASENWKICALLPTATDKYWWEVSGGLWEEAERLGITLGVYDAGGYKFIERQKLQFEECLTKRADAIILSAISPTAFDAEIEKAKMNNVPVIDLINGISSEKVFSHANVNFETMGEVTAKYVLDDLAGRGGRVVIFPGPKSAEWVRAAVSGINNILSKQANVMVENGGYGATDVNTQATLVRGALSKNTYDYVIANAMAATLAAKYLNQSPSVVKTKIVSFYSTREVFDYLQKGSISATASDQPVILARLSVDLTIRALENKLQGKNISPKARVFTNGEISKDELSTTILPEVKRFREQHLP